MKQENSAYRVKMIKRKKTWVSVGATTLAVVMMAGNGVTVTAQANETDVLHNLQKQTTVKGPVVSTENQTVTREQVLAQLVFPEGTEVTVNEADLYKGTESVSVALKAKNDSSGYVHVAEVPVVTPEQVNKDNEKTSEELKEQEGEAALPEVEVPITVKEDVATVPVTLMSINIVYNKGLLTVKMLSAKRFRNVCQ